MHISAIIKINDSFIKFIEYRIQRASNVYRFFATFGIS